MRITALNSIAFSILPALALIPILKGFLEGSLSIGFKLKDSFKLDVCNSVDCEFGLHNTFKVSHLSFAEIPVVAFFIAATLTVKFVS